MNGILFKRLTDRSRSWQRARSKEHVVEHRSVMVVVEAREIVEHHDNPSLRRSSFE